MVAALGRLGIPALRDIDKPLAALLEIVHELGDLVLTNGQLDGPTVLEAIELQWTRIVERSLQDTSLLRTFQILIGD